MSNAGLALLLCMATQSACQQEPNGSKLRLMERQIEKGIEKKSLSIKELYIGILLQTGQWNKGEEVYKKFIRGNPDTVIMGFAYAVFLERQGKTQESLKVLDALSKDHPKNARITYEIALCMIRQGNIRLAKIKLGEAIEQDPLFAPPYYELAVRANLSEEKLKWATRGLILAEPKSDLSEKLVIIIENAQKDKK